MSVYSRRLQRILRSLADGIPCKKVVARSNGSIAIVVRMKPSGRPTGKRLMLRARRNAVNRISTPNKETDA